MVTATRIGKVEIRIVAIDADSSVVRIIREGIKPIRIGQRLVQVIKRREVNDIENVIASESVIRMQRIERIHQLGDRS